MDVEFGACVASVTTGPLSIGAAVRDGRFYWQPGPAFHGDYSLSFTVTTCSGGTWRYTLNVRVE